MNKKQSVYDLITNDILAIMEKGVIPWQKPWRVQGKYRNICSKKPYQGVNVFILSCSGFQSPWWLTFQQAKQKGGMVRKGEKGRRVIFWKWLTKKVENPATEEESGKQFQIPLLRYYIVFNWSR